MRNVKISVVIPTLNEETEIGLAIQSAWEAGAGEVIVVDGGSRDTTVLEATKSGATKIVHSLPGRGVQLNAGAALVNPLHDVILFLHADNRLAKGCLQQIGDAKDVVWGAFRQRIDSDQFIFRLIEIGNALRVSLRRVPFGDQAVFVLREEFERQGGFEEIPLMEDVAFALKMRRRAKPKLLVGPLTVNCRRWRKRGAILQTLQNWCLQLAFRFGVKPQVLRDWYR